MISDGSACLAPMKATSNGSWQGDNPLDHAVPLVIVQIIIVVAFTRLLAFLLRPLRQPRVIAEIIGGILLGPSAIGRSEKFLHTIFPTWSLTVLDTLANIGLLFYLFLVGLELDLKAIRRTGKKTMSVAMAGITLPFLLGIGCSVVLRSTISKGVAQAPFLVFMGVALSITAFPVLARILAELKLLTTDVGRMAMSAAAVNDVAAWILLALAIALSGDGTSPLVSLWVLLTGAVFIVFATVAIRPALAWIARRSPDGDQVKEAYICVALAVVLGSAFVTDAIGIHALFGAFIVGIIVPKEGPFAGVLTGKIEDLVSGLFLPLYFVSSGLKTNVATIQGGQSWVLLVLVIATTCAGKIGGTVVASRLCKIPTREALALGFLMNTKGLVELIVLNIGKDRKVLNDQTFAILVLMALFTTFITTPLVTAVYHPARRAAPYKRRSIQGSNSDVELRVLVCFHSSRSLPTMINLIESTRGIGRRGLTVYAMHLVELSERPSAIAMVHKARSNGLPIWNKKRSSDTTDYIVVAFEAYQQLSSVSVRPMTAISDLSTIHEDICTSAQLKRAAIVILPFHKHLRFDGCLESFGGGFHHINQRVLRCAPCSVGIVIDRGLGGAIQVPASDISFSLVVLFFGGRDDREALAYGHRMAEHPGIALTVVHFIPAPGKSLTWGADERVNITERGSILSESEADQEYLQELKKRTAPGNPTVKWEEKEVEDKEQIVSRIKEEKRCNLFLVGRSPPLGQLMNKTDSPELGPVGSFLASPEFTSTSSSAIVIQQYDPSAEHKMVVEEVEGIQDVPDTPAPNQLASIQSTK